MNGLYECIFIFNPSLDDARLTTELNDIESIIKNCEGKIVLKNAPEKKLLGYKVKKNKEGWLVYLDVEISKSKVKQFYDALKLRDNVIKQTILKKEKQQAIG